VRYGNEGSSVSRAVPAWLRLLVRVVFRVEIHAILIYRYGRWAMCMGMPHHEPFRLLGQVWRAVHLALYFVLSKVSLSLSGISISVNAQIEGGIFFPHPGPIYINGEALIGKNLTMYPCTIIGGDHSRDGAPVLGDCAVLGAGCKVLGPITVGDHVTVGANAVVVKDVPSDCIAVGVPAVVKPRISS